ncbi:MAG: hypothetical protein WBJ37_09895 [Bacteroidales bacterium]
MTDGAGAWGGEWRMEKGKRQKAKGKRRKEKGESIMTDTETPETLKP